jgi:hypothetical protein
MGIKGTQMRIKLIATAVVAASLLEQPARAADTVCNGAWYQSQDRDIVTNDFTKNGKAYIIKSNTQASKQMKDFCDRESWFCIFQGHVVRRAGNNYFIDSIRAIDSRTTQSSTESN